jgi:hypothetical protein
MNLFLLFAAFILPLLFTSQTWSYTVAGCHITTLSNSGTTNGHVHINTSPLNPFENPTLSASNDTAWDHWYFDGVSSDGLSGLAITFSHDPNYIPPNYSFLHVDISAVFSDGTKYSNTLFVSSAVISRCDTLTSGFWLDSEQGYEFTFAVANDYSTANISLNSPDLSGTFSLTSSSQPHYPTGDIYPSSTSSTALAPLIYWTEPIPGGTVTASLSINNASFSLTGYGGHDRTFSPYPFDYTVTQWYWTRFICGPYIGSIWIWISALDSQQYLSAFLSSNGTSLFTTTISAIIPSEPPSGVPYAELFLDFDDDLGDGFDSGVHGSFGDNSTGLLLYFYEADGRNWSFNIQHENVQFETQAGANFEYSRFVNTASGGEAGGDDWEGVAVSDQVFVLVNAPLP